MIRVLILSSFFFFFFWGGGGRTKNLTWFMYNVDPSSDYSFLTLILPFKTDSVEVWGGFLRLWSENATLFKLDEHTLNSFKSTNTMALNSQMM